MSCANKVWRKHTGSTVPLKGPPNLLGPVDGFLKFIFKIPQTFTIKSLNNPSATPEIHFTSGTNHLDFEDSRFSDHLASSVQSNTSWYLRPQSLVFPSFDSFLYLPRISHPGFSPLIALQVTTAADHDINIKGLEKVQRELKP